MELKFPGNFRKFWYTSQGFSLLRNILKFSLTKYTIGKNPTNSLVITPSLVLSCIVLD